MSTLILTNNKDNINLYNNFIYVFLDNIRNPDTTVLSQTITCLLKDDIQNVNGKVVVKNNNDPNDSVYEKTQKCDYESAFISDQETVNSIVFIANKYPINVNEFRVVYNSVEYTCSSYVSINNQAFYVLNQVS